MDAAIARRKDWHGKHSLYAVGNQSIPGRRRGERAGDLRDDRWGRSDRLRAHVTGRGVPSAPCPDGRRYLGRVWHPGTQWAQPRSSTCAPRYGRVPPTPSSSTAVVHSELNAWSDVASRGACTGLHKTPSED